MNARPSPLFWRRVFLAPACLCAVAALHAYRVNACRQTPWKGGGFGMFSTVESEDSRFVRCWKPELGCMSAGEMPAESAPLPIPRSRSREELRVRVAPSQARLERIAAAMSVLEDVPVEVELWQYHFGAAASKLTANREQAARGEP